MLRVKLELVPFGQEKMARQIGELRIVNDGSHPDRPEYGNYKVALDIDGVLYGLGTVKNHLRSAGAWPLVRKALKAVKV